MLKYVETAVVFEEVPTKVSLAINISGCPCRCPLCHSKHLWGDIGRELNESALEGLICANKGINCIAFMGGDGEPSRLNELAGYLRKNHPELSIAWYSGRDKVNEVISLENFDFIKIGPYMEECGPINKEGTNQVFYEVKNGVLTNKTSLFWKRY